MVVADLFLGGFEFQAFFFHEIVDEANFFDVGGCVEAGSFIVAVWFDDGETAFPETQCRRRQSKHFGDFAYLIIFFFEFFHCDCVRRSVRPVVSVAGAGFLFAKIGKKV